MYNDTKNYLKKYWKELLLSVFVIGITVIATFQLLNFSETNYKNFFVSTNKLSGCTGHLLDVGLKADEKDKYNYDQFFSTFNFGEDIFKNNGCIFTTKELELGLDKIYSENVELLLERQQMYGKIDKISYIESEVSNFRYEVSDEEFMIENLPKLKKIFSEEDLKNIKTKNDFFLALYNKKLEYNNKIIYDTYLIQVNPDFQKVKTALINLVEELSPKTYFYEFNLFIVIILIFFLAMIIIFGILRKVNNNLYYRVIVNSVIFAYLGFFIIIAPVSLFFYITSYY